MPSTNIKSLNVTTYSCDTIIQRRSTSREAGREGKDIWYSWLHEQMFMLAHIELYLLKLYYFCCLLSFSFKCGWENSISKSRDFINTNFKCRSDQRKASRAGEHVVRPTCVPPNRQVLVLLDVQHDLQTVSCPSFHGGAECLPLLCSIEHVALPIPGEHLRGDNIRGKISEHSLTLIHRHKHC